MPPLVEEPPLGVALDLDGLEQEEGIVPERTRNRDAPRVKLRKPRYSHAGRRRRVCVDIIHVVANARERAPLDWPVPLPLIYDSLRWVDFAVALVWGALMWYGWIAKYFMENPAHFGHFLTNWSWAAQTVYFTLKVAALATTSARLLHWTYYWVFWPVWINCWAVMWLVILVLADSPGLVTDLFHQYGAGTVLAADRLYHVVTLVIMFIDFFVSLKDHFGFWYLKTGSAWLMILYQWLLAHFVVLCYLALNNIRSVYDLHNVYWWTMFLCYEPVALVAGVLFMFGCYQFRKYGGLDFSAA